MFEARAPGNQKSGEETRAGAKANSGGCRTRDSTTPEKRSAAFLGTKNDDVGPSIIRDVELKQAASGCKDKDQDKT
jgi:hypothetical protein